MSGPKISVYSLTGRAREIVLGQMRCEQQSLVCHTRTQEIMRSLQTVTVRFDQQLKNLGLLVKRTSEGAEAYAGLLTLQKEIQAETAEIQREMAAHRPHASVKYRISEEILAEKQEELKKLQELKKRAEDLQKRQQKALQHEEESHVEKIKESISEAVNGIVSFEIEEEEPDTGFQDKKDAVRKELSELLKDEALPEEIQSDIKNALFSLQRIEDMQYLKNFDAVTVMSIFKKIDQFKYEEEQTHAEYTEYCARYEALCAMAGEEAKQLPYDDLSMDILRTEVKRLELLIVRQQEQAYISECVDQVMADMGYDLIGTRKVQKKSGKHYRNELFTFNEGTAVNVTFAPDGQISMELGGLAREDRIPTAEETEVLTRDMESFCDEFDEFERRMLEKGVVVGNRIALSPPAAEYAGIINVNDYEIDASTQISVMDAKEKRRRQAEKKVMRRDE